MADRKPGRVATAELVRSMLPAQAVQSLMVRSDAPGIRHLFGHAMALLAAGALVAAASGGWGVWPAMFLLGIVLTHLFAPQHECAHFSVFRSRRANAWVAWACGALIMVPQVHFRWEHHHHHTFTNLRGQDPELIDMPATRWDYLWYLSGVPYWWSSWSGIARRSLGRLDADEQRFIPPAERATVVREARVLAALYGTVLLLVLAGWTAPLTYWLGPLLLGQPVMRYIRMTEHVGRPQIPDPLQNTRTTRVAVPWRLLAWNMNYHAEHHLLPSVPFHALPRFHALLQGRIPPRHGYREGHREILARLRGELPQGAGVPPA